MTNWRRRAVDRLGEICGVEVFRKASRPWWPEADFVRRLFAHLEPDCVFDVGANEGWYASSLRGMGYKGTILSFEPNPRAFERLAANASADADWHPYPYAFGASPGVQEFNVMKSDLFSSFRTPAASDDAQYGDLNVITEVVPVEVRTVDAEFVSLKAAHSFARPFLKMDTQGYDLEVLLGATATANAFVGLLSEVSILPIYEQMPTIAESLQAFRDAGFAVLELFDVHPDEEMREMVEANCYCIRRDRAH